MEQKEKNLLIIKDLCIGFRNGKSMSMVTENLSFTVKQSEIVCLVGESGCGKSVTALAAMCLLNKRNTAVQGEIWFRGRNLTELSEREIRKIRGKELAMIFQNPISSFHPSLTIGYQITEAIRVHESLSRMQAEKKAVELLGRVGMPEPDKIIKRYPHTLSGGMRQRAMTAMALACRPKLLIADEPTTALDVTVQAQILDLFLNIKEEGNTSILLITHDMRLVAEIADRVFVMYAGEIVEEADVFDIYSNPQHPYTRLLLYSLPEKYVENSGCMPEGVVPANYGRIQGCRFFERCSDRRGECRSIHPELYGLGHRTRCLFCETAGGVL